MPSIREILIMKNYSKHCESNILNLKTSFLNFYKEGVLQNSNFTRLYNRQYYLQCN